MSYVDEMNGEIQRREKELIELKRKHVAIKAEPKNQKLARHLHDKLCNFNHTDGCGWYYEIRNGIDDWSGHAHSAYLTKANLLLTAAKTPGPVDVHRIIKIVNIVSGS